MQSKKKRQVQIEYTGSQTHPMKPEFALASMEPREARSVIVGSGGEAEPP